MCKDYNVGASDTIKKRTCSLERGSSRLSCPRSPSSSPSQRPSSVTIKPPTSPPRSPSSGPCLRSGKNCEESVVTITSFEVQTGSDGTEDQISAMVRTQEHGVYSSIFLPTLIRNPSAHYSMLHLENNTLLLSG